MTKWLVPLFVVLVAVGCSQSETTSPTVVESAGPAPMSPEAGPGARISGSPIGPVDSSFLKDAAMDGMAEVRLGELAGRQGASEDVRRFGEKLVTDHRSANQELMRLSSMKAVSVPDRLSEEGRRTVDELSGKTGADFDRAWIDQIVQDHEQDIEKFQRQAEGAQDPDVKAFASKTLPTLQDHLRRAQEIQKSLGEQQ